MNRGEVLIVPVRKSDSDEYKPRPVLVVSNEEINKSPIHKEIIILPITSEPAAMQNIKDTDVIVDPAVYPSSNLKRRSKLETARLRYVKKAVVRRSLGALPAELMSEIDSHLAYNLEIPQP